MTLQQVADVMEIPHGNLGITTGPYLISFEGPFSSNTLSWLIERATGWRPPLPHSSGEVEIGFDRSLRVARIKRGSEIIVAPKK
jgi:hypothetical protein